MCAEDALYQILLVPLSANCRAEVHQENIGVIDPTFDAIGIEDFVELITGVGG